MGDEMNMTGWKEGGNLHIQQEPDVIPPPSSLKEEL